MEKLSHQFERLGASLRIRSKDIPEFHCVDSGNNPIAYADAEETGVEVLGL